MQTVIAVLLTEYANIVNKHNISTGKQIINAGEGDGTNYHFWGDLDVAIFPKLRWGKIAYTFSSSRKW